MIKRLIIRLLLLVFVTLLLAPWALKRENGTRIISFDEFSSFDVSLITSRYKEAMNGIRSFMADDMEMESVKETEVLHPKSRTMYKWKNEKGEWNFTDRIPDGYPYEEIVVEMNTNVFDFEDIKKKDNEENNNTDNADSQE